MRLVCQLPASGIGLGEVGTLRAAQTRTVRLSAYPIPAIAVGLPALVSSVAKLVAVLRAKDRTLSVARSLLSSGQVILSPWLFTLTSG